MTQRTTRSGNAPALIAYHVPDRRNAPWLKIGAAWPHQNGGGFSLKIEMLPTDVFRTGELQIQLREPRDEDEDSLPADDVESLDRT